MAIEWDVTEPIPANLGGRTTVGGQTYQVETNAIDIAVGDLPFLLYPSEDHPYERSTAQWRKDQFDAERNVGEQSLTGWWLRSQSDFSGGAGITYYEPLLGEGSENRFIDSSGVDVFDEDGVHLLKRFPVVQAGAGDDLEASGIGLGYTLYRDGGNFYRISDTDVTSVTPIGSNPEGIARVPDAIWLIGHDTGIGRMRDSGSTSDVVTGATAPLRPYWCKDRIFAAQNHRILELTLGSGDISATEDDLVVHQDPSPAWRWVGIVETPGAVWAAGGALSRSHVVAFSVNSQDELPNVQGAPVRIQMPLGERITCIEAYLDFLIIGTTEGVRVAVTDGDQAQLGPLLWDDEVPRSITARYDYVWVGVSQGKTRRINLGSIVGQELQFAWAHDAEVEGGGGDVMGLGWVFGRMTIASANAGLAREHSSQLVEDGWIRTGFARFGTLEKKRIQSAMILADSTNGSIGISAASREDAYTAITVLGTWSGSREVDLNLPGGNPPVEQMSLEIALNRSEDDSTQGPVLEAYQLRAIPTPAKKQRLISLPLMCYDKETDRWGSSIGVEGFAYHRLHELEMLEDSGIPTTFRDFRTGESRRVVVDQVQFTNLSAPTRDNHNFGGWITLVLRTID